MNKLPLPFTVEPGDAGTEVVVWGDRPDNPRIATRETRVLYLHFKRAYQALRGCLLVDWMDEGVQQRAEMVLPYIRSGDVEQLRQYVRKESGE